VGVRVREGKIEDEDEGVGGGGRRGGGEGWGSRSLLARVVVDADVRHGSLERAHLLACAWFGFGFGLGFGLAG
jgi:hypothetical protein